jgi:hypothetical protein
VLVSDVLYCSWDCYVNAEIHSIQGKIDSLKYSLQRNIQQIQESSQAVLNNLEKAVFRVDGGEIENARRIDICHVCPDEVEGAVLYCSNRCRQKAYRQRKKNTNHQEA